MCVSYYCCNACKNVEYEEYFGYCDICEDNVCYDCNKYNLEFDKEDELVIIPKKLLKM